MIISILSVDNKYGIGKNNGLLFHLPIDMKFFRETTRGHMVFMGENTLLSFPESKPLKNRVNVVLSKDSTHNYEGCENVHSFDEFIKKLQENGRISDVFVIGGASIYRQTLPYVDKVLLVTAVNYTVKTELKNTIKALENVNAHVAGCVANNIIPTKGHYGSYYYYGEKE